LLRRGPLRSVRATRRGIRLKQAPKGVSLGVEQCWVFAGVGCPALAVRVDQAGVVRCGLVRVGGHVVFGDRFAGDPMPLLPFGGAAWLVVGVQSSPWHSAQRPFCLVSRIRTLRSSRGLFLPRRLAQ
jgi:hypothetical protein